MLSCDDSVHYSMLKLLLHVYMDCQMYTTCVLAQFVLDLLIYIEFTVFMFSTLNKFINNNFIIKEKYDTVFLSLKIRQSSYRRFC